MRTSNFFTRMVGFMAVAALSFAVSCSEEEAVLQQESSEAVEEAVVDSYFEDADDMANLSVMNSTEEGRISEGDDRIFNACVAIDVTFEIGSTLENPIGTIVLDFSGTNSEGCTDLRGNVRNGKIVIVFTGRRLTPGSVAVITFIDYEINGITLSGTRTVTNISANLEVAPKFSIVLEDGVITWPDGTDAKREHDLELEWHRENIPANDYMLVWGSASGENRRGIAYEMEIDDNHPIRHNRFCPLPVSGIKTITTAAHTIVIDFGAESDGCDGKFIITVDGVVRTVNN